MKQINKYNWMLIPKQALGIALLSVVLFTTSCSEDVLDIKPTTDISEADIFGSEELLKFYVNGRYYAFPSFDFGAASTDFMSDDRRGHGGNAYVNGLTTSLTDIPQNRWGTDYAHIRDINFFFSRIEESNLDPDVKKVLTGEMRLIRAWLYADLVSLYGDVILITDLPQLGQENFDKAKSPYQDVVDFIVSELDQALTELPNIAFNVSGGRVSKGVALALKARILLYAASPLHNNGNYDDSKLTLAKQAAQEVIDLETYSLEPDFANIFKTPDYSNEIIFARTFNAQHIPFNLWGVTSVDRYYLPYAYSDIDLNWAQPLQALVDAFEMTNGLPIDDSASGYDPQDPYQNRDPRLSKSIIHQGSVLPVLPGVTDNYDNGDGTITIRYDKDKAGDPLKDGNSYTTTLNSGYNVLKRASPGMPMRGIRNAYKPWIHFRLAEMYLIIAEAEAELGNSQDAMNALNTIRNRAGMPDVTGLTGEDLRSRYRNEKRVEFAFENMRWYDITRWMIAPEVLTEEAKGIEIIRDNSVSPAIDEYIYDSNVLDKNRTWIDKMYFMPIPFSEVQANSLLEPTPGYE